MITFDLAKGSITPISMVCHLCLVPH